MSYKDEQKEYIFRFLKDEKLHKIAIESKENRIKTYVDIKGDVCYKDKCLVVGDYKKNFYQKYKLNKKGSVMYSNGYDPNDKERKDEVETANWFAKEFGWDIELVKEDSNAEGKKFVDMLSNKQWWEIKASSSKNSIDKQTEKALHQLEYKDQKEIGGFIININVDNSYKLNGIDNKEIAKVVENRINRTCKVDCYGIIRKNNKITSIIRVRHK